MSLSYHYPLIIWRTSLSLSIILRIIVVIIGGTIAWEIGVLTPHVAAFIGLGFEFYQAILAVVGGVLGYVLAPHFTTKPFRAVYDRLASIPVRVLIQSTIGMVIGFLMGALLAGPLGRLPGVIGQILPGIAALLLGFIGARIGGQRGEEILAVLGLRMDDSTEKRHVVLLDTSVIIDGRIADIARSGFIREIMVVPRFVLNELQYVADSADVLRRNRGRRGLDVLNRLEKAETASLEISEEEVDEVEEVDSKLVTLARRLDCPILTNDYNLNRIAELQHVQVLNINELANAVKAIVLPGESLEVTVIQEGKEAGQGVGYLDDGTMIVIEDGKRLIGRTISITVTRVLQTVAGRMIFGQLTEETAAQD